MNFKTARTRWTVGGVAILAAALLVGTVLKVQAAPPQQTERWLHVRVDDPSDKDQMVRVNVPVALAEAVISHVNHDQFHNGHIHIGHMGAGDLNGTDIRAILDAVRTAHDGEFITVKNRDEDVSVAKQNGMLVVRVNNSHKSSTENVEIHVPMAVVDALLSAGGDDLNVAAAIHALAAHGDTELVSVKDGRQTVRVWLDSKNTSE